MTDHTIGIDISKDWLDAYRLSDEQHHRFANDKAGFKALIKWMHATGDVVVTRVVIEPTGPYHRDLEMALTANDIPLVKVNPRQARRFFEGMGTLAKTDKVDAKMLARMGALLEMAPRAKQRPIFHELKELHVAREALIKDRTAAKNRSKVLSLTLLKRQNAGQLRQIEKQLKEIEAAIIAHVKADAEMTASFDILTSIPGISTITAFAILIEMPELGTLEPGQAAALAGLAPITQQSGKKRGPARIAGGRAKLRQALYMPALVATRYNPDLKSKYDQLRAKGKLPKVAITAIMRKLLILANALLKANRKWEKRSA